MPAMTPSPARAMAGIAPQQLSSHQSHRSPYSPDPHELHAGAKNRLFLSLRSSIESEIDWALPRLVLASFEHPDHFRLETWVDSVGALQAWPEIWLEELEREAALMAVRDGLVNGSKREVLGAIPEWTNSTSTEFRAIHSLLVLRNASFVGNNAKIICRATFLAFLARFFALPIPFLLDVTLRSPEPIQHIFVILQSIFPHIHPSPPINRIFATVLPNLLIETRDLAMLNLLLPLLNSSFILPKLPPPPDTLVPHLLNLLTLQPPAPSLELTLDLLISLTLQSSLARSILALPTFPAYLKTLVMMLEHGARPTQASWEAPGSHSLTVRNPASGAVQAEEASRRRAAAREAAQRNMEIFGGPGVLCDVGDEPPSLSQATKSRLYSLPEPRRSIAWMHETFVYCSTSQLLQVTFWHAYRDFFQHPSTVEQLLSASEVIKNVTVAFPGASAKVRTDGSEQRFVIAGMGFRKGSDEDDRFTCLWAGCTAPGGASNTARLLQHIQTDHLTTPPTRCSWSSCRHSPFSLSHLLTHLPQSRRPAIPDDSSADSTTPEHRLSSPLLTSRPPPPLSKSFKLHFTGDLTPSDARRNPTGCSFLSALMIRNLARSLRSETITSLPADHGLSSEAKQEKKRLLQEERFGLPIPDSVLKEEEEEEKENSADREGGLTALEGERARGAFESVEGRVVEVVERNMSGVGQYLGDAFGW